MKYFLRTILPVFTILSLAGCSAFPAYKAETADSSVGAGGRYKQVEQGAGLSPEEMHARARAQVEPTKMVQHNAYVKDAKLAKVELESHHRVVEMERDLGVVKSEFKGLKDVVARAEIAPAAGKASAVVKALRTGEHPGKTRLVLDLDGPVQYQYDLDNAQNLLVIRLSAARWAGAQEKVFKNGKILKAYAAKVAENGGVIVALKLKGPAKVLTAQKLGKNAAGNYRIFLDIAPL